MKNGPVSRKFTCTKCKVYRWVEQFGGRSASVLGSDSVCDLCLLEERATAAMSSAIAAAMAPLQAEVEILRAELAALKGQPCTCSEPKEAATPEKAAAATPEKAAKKKKKKKKKKKNKKKKEKENQPSTCLEPEVAVAPEKETKKKKKKNKKKKAKKNSEVEGNKSSTEVKKGKQAADGWTVVQSKKAAKSKPQKIDESKKAKAAEAKTKPQTSMKKPPKIIEASGVILFGDSQTKGLQIPLASRLHRNVKVSSLPGRGNASIRKEVERSQISESSVVAIAVSGNDLYLRNNRIEYTERIISDTMGAVDDAGLKTRRRLVIGMLPRRVPGQKAYSKNLAINQRLSDLCVAERVLFVNPYHLFYGRNDFYQRDGVHLSMRGKTEFANFVVNAVRRCERINHRVVDSNISPYVTPGRSFSDVVSGETREAMPRSGNGGT